MWPWDTVFSNLSRDKLNHELPSLSLVSITTKVASDMHRMCEFAIKISLRQFMLKNNLAILPMNKQEYHLANIYWSCFKSDALDVVSSNSTFFGEIQNHASGDFNLNIEFESF